VTWELLTVLCYWDQLLGQEFLTVLCLPLCCRGLLGNLPRGVTAVSAVELPGTPRPARTSSCLYLTCRYVCMRTTLSRSVYTCLPIVVFLTYSSFLFRNRTNPTVPTFLTRLRALAFRSKPAPSCAASTDESDHRKREVGTFGEPTREFTALL
jgi:hypothetical protein